MDNTIYLDTAPTLDRAEPWVDPANSSNSTPATNVELVASLGDVGALRGVTDTAADLAPCTCPEHCERDHANE